jgi:hypothetical protein
MKRSSTQADGDGGRKAARTAATSATPLTRPRGCSASASTSAPSLYTSALAALNSVEVDTIDPDEPGGFNRRYHAALASLATNQVRGTMVVVGLCVGDTTAVGVRVINVLAGMSNAGGWDVGDGVLR